MSMHGKVHEWKMTPEELAAYREKYPIKQIKKTKGKKDFKWRGDKAAESRWGATGHK